MRSRKKVSPLEVQFEMWKIRSSSYAWVEG